MKKYTLFAPVVGVLMTLSATSASAVVFNFIDLVDNKIGERGFLTLSGSDHPDLDHFGMKITGHSLGAADNDPQQFAYLDKKNSKGVAGLGVCKDIDGNNQCTPASDDNVTNHEYLEFMFDQDVRVDRIWFNNNHDNGINEDLGEGPGDDRVDIGINMNLTDYALLEGYAGDANFIGSFLVKKGDKLNVAYFNEQFYISAMEVSAVPVPAAVWLFGTAIAGLIGFQRRRKAA